MKKPGIICTLGPSSSSPEVFSAMSREGMTAARLNFSHGTRPEHAGTIAMVKKFNRRRKNRVFLLQDLEGYRIRIASAGGGEKLDIEKGRKYYWGREENNRKNYIRFDYEGPLGEIKPGSVIYADDGMMCFNVLDSGEKLVKTEAAVPGELKRNKGINLPGVKLSFSGIKEKDVRDIEFGLLKGVDFIAQSFVRSAADMHKVRELTGSAVPSPALIAKIECREGLENIDEIISASEGVMIARGDMGVSVEVYKVPVFQKKIIRKCRAAGRFVITATQMLESMTRFPGPTRAEVSDVANAVLDGSDYLMLSGETAAGAYPVESVRMMKKTIDYTISDGAGLGNRTGWGV